MRRRQFVQIVVLCIALFTFFSTASPLLATSDFTGKTARLCDHSTNNIAYFPAALKIICEEAFLGTSIEAIVFDNSLEQIRDRAFMDTSSLTDVFIPERTNYISTDAFPAQITIHAAKNSYAHSWAKEGGFKYAIDKTENNRSNSKRILFGVLMLLLYIILFVKIWFVKKTCKNSIYERSMRPQDRIELYPINYKFP